MPQISGTLFENIFLGEAIKTQTADAARSGDWISLKGYAGCLIIVSKLQGNAGTVAITLDKAKTNVGGSNSDGITMKRIWKMVDTPQTAATAWTAVTAAASVTTSATGSGSSLYAIDVKAEDLGDDYDYIQLELGSSGSANNSVTALYILYGSRYAGSLGGVIDPRA